MIDPPRNPSNFRVEYFICSSGFHWGPIWEAQDVEGTPRLQSASLFLRPSFRPLVQLARPGCNVSGRTTGLDMCAAQVQSIPRSDWKRWTSDTDRKPFVDCRKQCNSM